MNNIGLGKKVKVHYVGTLKDGSEFDNSIRKNKKRTQPLDLQW